MTPIELESSVLRSEVWRKQSAAPKMPLTIENREIYDTKVTYHITVTYIHVTDTWRYLIVAHKEHSPHTHFFSFGSFFVFFFVFVCLFVFIFVYVQRAVFNRVVKPKQDLSL